MVKPVYGSGVAVLVADGSASGPDDGSTASVWLGTLTLVRVGSSCTVGLTVYAAICEAGRSVSGREGGGLDRLSPQAAPSSATTTSVRMLRCLCHCLIGLPVSCVIAGYTCKIFSLLPANDKEAQRAALAQLAAGIIENVAGDDQAVDLPGAFIDIGDLGVAEPFFQQQIAAVADRTHDLDRFLGYFGDYIASPDLTHGSLQRVVFAIVSHPDGFDHQEPSRAQHDFHIDEILFDAGQLLRWQAIA